MGSTFNPQILVDKLSKLNNSQQSIETLSHWCIFHMNKAKPVVETWATQFHCSPREQRLAFLYLANDILQNSRRKGSEFVGEFWKVLPDALRDVIDCGGEFGRNAAIRLIRIWEERKVFGSRGQILKEELLGRQAENSNRNDKLIGMKLKHCGNTVDKLISDYQAIYGGPLDEDAILSKCRVAISIVEKMDKEIARDTYSEQLHGSGFVEEFQGQYGILKDCVEQLIAVESSRASLVSDLRVALQEQENKLDLVRSQLQTAQAHSDQACNMCQRLLNTSNIHFQNPPEHSKASNNGDQPMSVLYAHHPHNVPQHSEDDPQKSAAAAVAAKLTASTSSAQMLTFVLSSLASEGLIGNPVQPTPSSGGFQPSSGSFQMEKRPKFENEQINSLNSSLLLRPIQNPQIAYPPLPLLVPPLQPPMPPYNGGFSMGYNENGGMPPFPPPALMTPYLNFQGDVFPMAQISRQ